MTVKVKPLVWKDYGSYVEAKTQLGPMAVQPEGSRFGYWIAGQDEDADPYGYEDTIETAKAAAQADYEARILAAIEAPVQEPVQGEADPFYEIARLNDETAALRSKLAEVARELACVVAEMNRAQKTCEVLAIARDEERKLADDLAQLHNTPETERIRGWDAHRDTILARHAARRKGQQ